MDSTAVKALQQGIVECLGRGRAQKMPRPSTAAKEVSSSDDSSYHWIQASAAERVGLSQCNDLSTIISSSHRFHALFIFSSPHLPSLSFFLLSTHKSCSDGGLAKQQVEVTTGSCSQEPACRRLWTSGRSSLYPGQQRSPAASMATEQPFSGKHCSP